MRLFFFSILLCVGICQNGLGQTVDSLERILKTEKISSEKRIETLNLLSRDLSFVNPLRSLQLANEALERSTETNNLIGQAYAYRNLSGIYYDNESYFQGMEYLNQALDIFKKKNDTIGVANCFISLGHLYRQLNNRKLEIFYHKKSFETFSELRIVDRIGVTSHNLGESYFLNKEYSKSRKLTRYAIDINKSANNLPVLSACYKVMGMVEFADKNYTQAESHFLSVLEISNRLGANSQKIATAESLFQLALLYQVMGNEKSYVEHLKKAAIFSRNNSLPNHLQSIYTQLIFYYSKKNNQLEVQKYVLEYNDISESIRAKQFKNRADLVKSTIQVHNLENQKTKLVLGNLQQAAKLNNRNMIIITALFLSCFLAWGVFKLKKANQELTKVNRILYNQQLIIENQKVHLEDLNKTKDKFFSIVAHDLKSPLNNLKSFSGIMVDDIETISKEEISQMSKQLQASVDNTIKLADNLITWASIQMKEYKTNIDKVYLSEILSSVLDVYAEVAQSKKVHLKIEYDNDMVFLGDRYQITFVIRNLINNAIKFSYSGGFVMLNAKYLPDNWLQISVSDNGTGISEAVKGKLFAIDKQQSIAGTAGEKGTGLGLMLCHDFMKLNNGTIEVQSKEGEGTTFTIRLKTA